MHLVCCHWSQVLHLTIPDCFCDLHKVQKSPLRFRFLPCPAPFMGKKKRRRVKKWRRKYETGLIFIYGGYEEGYEEELILIQRFQLVPEYDILNVLQIYDSGFGVGDSLLKVWFSVFVYHLTELQCVEKQPRSFTYSHCLLELFLEDWK